MQKLTPCLWFDGNAEEAARFYVSIFPHSRIDGIARYGKAAAKASGNPEGSVMTVSFQLDGQDFLALNGGPAFHFTPAISFMANCETQKELDELWEILSEGGEVVECGWLRDKYGMSWQIVPSVCFEMMKDPDIERTDRVTQALVQMKKLDVETLKRAYEQPTK